MYPEPTPYSAAGAVSKLFLSLTLDISRPFFFFDFETIRRRTEAEDGILGFFVKKEIVLG